MNRGRDRCRCTSSPCYDTDKIGLKPRDGTYKDGCNYVGNERKILDDTKILRC